MGLPSADACLAAASALAAGPPALDEAVRTLAEGDPVEYSYSLTDLNGDNQLSLAELLQFNNDTKGST